jgi:PAS domain S-box-containing protein
MTELRRRPAGWALLLAAQAAVLAGAAYWFFEVHAPRERLVGVGRWRAVLTAMATDRERGLDSWLRHCQADARNLAAYPTVHYLLEGGPTRGGVPFPEEEGPRRHAEELVRAAALSHGYRSVRVADRRGAVALEVVLDDGLAAGDEAAAVEAVLAGGEPVVDVARNAGGVLGLVVAAPIRGALEKAPAGVLVLDVDPEEFFLPLLRSEPQATQSGESVLARRDGGEVLFLVTLRHQAGPPLSRRHPLEVEGFAMREALSGRAGFGELRDYRGVPVLAATRHLQSVPWGLVVKVDAEEALAPHRRRLALQAGAGASVLLALGGLGLAFALALRSTQARARVAAERQAGLSSRLYATLSEVNKQIIRCSDPQELFGGACRALAETGGFPLSWVGLKQPDGSVSVAAASGSALGYLQAIAVRWDDTLEGRGPSGRAIREGTATVIDDLEREDAFGPWRERARAHGLRSAAAFPIARSGEIIGALRVYASQPAALGAEERRLVGELAADIGFGLEVLAQRETLQRHERRLSALFESGLIGILVGQVDGRVLDANDTLLSMLGYSREELSRGELSLDRITAPEHRSRDAQGLAEAMQDGTCTPYEKDLLHKDGGRIPVLVGFVLEEPDRVRAVAFILDARPLKAAERAAGEAEERFRVFMDNLPLAVAIRDSALRHVYVNPAMVALVGRPRDEILGRRFEALIDAEAARGEREHDERLLATRNAERFEYETGVEGGGRSFVAWRLPIPLPDGSVLIGAMALDVTRRTRAAEEARRLAAIVEATTEFVGLARPDGEVLYVNPAGRRLLGIAADADLRGTRIAEYHPEGAGRKLLETGLPAATRDGVWVSESTVRATNGLEIPVEQMILAHRNAEGRLTALSTIMRDLREQKRNESRYRSLVEQAPDAILLVESRTGHPVEVNPAAERLLGRPAEALRQLRLPVDVSPLLQPDGRASAERAVELESAALAEGPQAFEWVFQSAVGEPLPCEVRLSHVPDPERELLRVSVTDLRERRDLQEQFRQAQKMEAVGRLAGGIAHDFNNLLNVILGYGEMLLRRADPASPDHRRVEQVVRAAERGAGLTRQLLAFSRKQVLQPRVLDPSALLRDTEQMLARVLGEDVELTLTLDARSHVRADPGQIEQAVMNLAVNARDAMPNGGALRITSEDTVVTGREPGVANPIPPGAYVTLSVRDSGIGMDEGTLSHIFEPFFTTKPEGKGTGLGLATVYGVVRQSGGHVRVESKPGGGTVFRIHLPSVDEELQPASPAPGRDAERRGTETILLVEDEPPARELVAEVLRERGYTVLLAADGLEALERAASAGRIDLLLTDVVLPRASGPVTARALQNTRPGLKVLFMSGYTRETVLERGVAEGWTILEKPFTPSRLLRVVRERLDAAD